MRILKIIGGVLVAIGLAAMLAELLHNSLLIYYGNPVGGFLGMVGIAVGAILITIATEADKLREAGFNVLKWYIVFVDGYNENLGIGVGWFTTVMVVVVFVNVVLRYVFGQSLLALQDMSWQVFGVVFLIGAAYTLKYDRHVRVDIFYVNYPPKVKLWINLLGSILLLVPFCILGIWVSWDFVERSFMQQEVSPDAGGLAARYLAKSLIPIGFFLILLQGISFALKSFLQLIGKLPMPPDSHAHMEEQVFVEDDPDLSNQPAGGNS